MLVAARGLVCLCTLGGALIALLLWTTIASAQLLTPPQPGDVYRDYTRIMSVFGNDWRVTDPLASFVGTPGNSPATFLPNPQLPLTIDDLTDAVRAEVLIDIWGGHVGTTMKQLRFNGNPWLTIPEITTPPTAGECYTQQLNVCIEVPLSHLVTGVNILEGTSGGQTCYNFNWGQWGWYMATVRIFYDSSKPHATGSITSHTNGGTLSDFATVSATASGGAGVSHIEFFAHYDGYDRDGDGVYQQYHEAYQRAFTDTTLVTRGHVGTDFTAPYEVTWNTDCVPDQPLGSLKLIARIVDNAGICFVTDEVTGLSLVRNGTSVKLYKPQNVPEHFWVRTGDTESSTVSIPGSDNLADAVYAKLLVRTWNGIDGLSALPHHTKVNLWTAPNFGLCHFFSFDVLDVPTTELNNGTNTIEFHSQSTHHGVEILWPGPAILVRFDVPIVPPPSQPTGLAAAPQSSSKMQLSWNPNPEPMVTYNLYRSTSGGFTASGANLIANGILASPYVDTELAEGGTYYYQLTAVSATLIGSTPSLEINGTTLVDGDPPTIVSAIATTAQSVTLVLSEDVDATTAQNASNYTLVDGGTPIAIFSASLSVDLRTVTLSTAMMPQGSLLTLTVTGVLDLAAAPNAANDSTTLQFLDGLLAQWDLEEGSGTTAADISGNGNTGTLFGPAWTMNTPPTSMYALEFDGVSDYVDIGAMDVAGSELSITVWFKAESFAVADGRLITKATGTFSTAHVYMLSTVLSGGDYLLRARLQTATTTTLFATSGSLQLDTWTHAAMTYDGSFLRLYKDGTEVGSTPLTGAIPKLPLVNAAIGNQPVGAGSKPFHGCIDDVRIYDRALTLAEVQALASPPTCPDCFVRGECDNNGGIDVGDAVFLLEYLFIGGPPSTCMDACDANDDGMLALTDPLSILCSVFCVPALGLPGPGPACGVDPTGGDLLDCGVYDCP